MMKLGEIQTLRIDHMKAFGAFLTDGAAGAEGVGTVLLPAKEVPAGAKEGSEVEVFLYRDSQDRLIATVRRPKILLHQTALLTVRETGKIGAFLDWGLEKDLLLPFREQTRRVKKGEEVLAALYTDKSDRLCATMNVYPYLRTDSPYGPEDRVSGRIYETSENFGVFVAVDDCYSALIPAQEAQGELPIGAIVDARVTGVRPDGKLNLSVREKAWLQMDKDAELVWQGLKEYEGVLPFDDHASPEVIKREFGLSKNAFKRAVGRLMKEGRAEIRDRHIYAVTKEE